MADLKFTETIRQFIAEHINSLAHLELLFLLYKFPGKEWTPSTVSNELRSNPIITLRILNEFTQKHIVKIVEDEKYPKYK